jgi:transposase
LKSNFPGNSTDHRSGIGFLIVDADLEWACRAWKALGPSLKKEETLVLIPEENVLMDTGNAWISARQISAGFGMMLTPAATEDVVVVPNMEKRVAKKPVRKPFPEHLEVVEERLEPADKTCSHGGREQCLVREESSERLDLIPARLIRRRTVRPVYACSACKDQSPVQVPMPSQVIDKGICGPGHLAHVVLSKYLQHLPLYRVQQELTRFGVEITRTTLADWVAATATALEPLYRLVRNDLMAGNYLQIDETPVQVMDPEVEGRTATGWLWVYARPGAGVIFDFQKGRGRDGPDRMLKSFAGTFQSDGYGLYE